MLSVLCWRWGNLFASIHVNRLRNMLARHLDLPHRLYCITDDPRGIDARVEIVIMPRDYAHTPRCQRRMQQYAKEFDIRFGPRLLALDLDTVIVDNITPIVDRPEPICMYRIDYAGVYAGAFVLWDAGALDGAFRAFARDPIGYPSRARGSDQAMTNLWLRETNTKVAAWTDRDGFVLYFGKGYERHAHRGVGPSSQTLPAGSRVVLLGSADIHVMDEGKLPWISEHWR